MKSSQSFLVEPEMRKNIMNIITEYTDQSLKSAGETYKYSASDYFLTCFVAHCLSFGPFRVEGTNFRVH